MVYRLSKLHVIRIVCYILIFIAVFFLFYEESIGAYSSDLYLQIDAALYPTSDSYTLTKPIFLALYQISGYYGIALFLALCEIATVMVSEALLNKLLPNIKPHIVFIVALLSNFAIAIHVPMVHELFNVGLSEGNEWHNSTYTVMRLLALVALCYWMKFDENWMNMRAAMPNWLLFTVLTTMATMVKPNFVVALGPTLVLFCAIDVIENGRKALKKSAMLAISMVVVLAVLIYQYTVLYASDENSGIGFGFAVVWRNYHDNLLVAILQSYAFLICVFVGCWRAVRSDRSYRFALLMFAIALVEYLLISETGDRAGHGNFDWGLSFAVYYATLISSAVLLKGYGCGVFLISEGNEQQGIVEKNVAIQSPMQKYAKQYLFVTSAVFMLHALSGAYYFLRLLLGFGYD